MTGTRKCEPGCTCKKHSRLTDEERAQRHREQSREGMRKFHRTGAPCPSCGGPKTRQSLLCGGCRRAAQTAGAVSPEERRRQNAEYMRERRANDPGGEWVAKERERNRVHGRKYFLKYRFGLTLERWDALLISQSGRCYLCEDLLTSRIDVDHDHSCCPGSKTCGKCIRGLACQKCNQGVGQFGDDPDRMELVARNLRAANDHLREGQVGPAGAE